MPIAKETLYIGGVIAAQPGGYVSKDAVKQHGWSKRVDDGADVNTGKTTTTSTTKADKA